VWSASALLAGAGALWGGGGMRALAQSTPASPGPPTAASPSPTAPVAISLSEAIERARSIEPTLANSRAASVAAGYDRALAVSALLPQAIYHNQYLFTQPNGLTNAAGQVGSQAAPRFIANNAIREYASLAQVTEALAPDARAQVLRAGAADAQAKAELEIAQRGLVATVVAQYFGLLDAQEKRRTAERAQTEASNFLSLTRKLENGREVAHADVVKAELQFQQRERDLQDAILMENKARLDLGVLLFPDPSTAYQLSTDPEQPVALPARADVNAVAMRNNPELRSALSALGVASEDLTIAKLAYLPDLILNVTYGIDAPQFATYGPATTDPVSHLTSRPKNLGYSYFGTVDIPVWNWLATRDRVKQAGARRDAAKAVLTYTQRRLVAQFDELYDEASVANSQLQSLETSVATARDSLRLTALRYQAGEGTVLDVVSAQDAMVLAENARADGMVRYRTALANLQTLTGVLPQ
jgi:outer membrane protein TolC